MSIILHGLISGACLWFGIWLGYIFTRKRRQEAMIIEMARESVISGLMNEVCEKDTIIERLHKRNVDIITQISGIPTLDRNI